MIVSKPTNSWTIVGVVVDQDAIETTEAIQSCEFSEIRQDPIEYPGVVRVLTKSSPTVDPNDLNKIPDVSKELRELSPKDQFLFHCEKWREESVFLSSPSEMAKCEPYQEIIKMGEKAIPFIIDQLRSNDPDHWFFALSQITDEDPIAPENYGNLKNMANDWISWYENGK